MAKTRDYDAPLRSDDDGLDTASFESLKAADSSSAGIDDDGEITESFDIPTVDLTGEELNVDVIPRRDDEFTCSVCFLVQKRKRIARVEPDGSEVCFDCE